MDEDTKPLSEEDVLKAHDEAHKAQAALTASHYVDPEKRDPKRLYLKVPFVREGYYDELTPEELAAIKQRSKDDYDSLMVLVKEFKNPPKPKAQPPLPDPVEQPVTAATVDPSSKPPAEEAKAKDEKKS